MVVILGGRSGTSALAGALARLGATLPRNLIPANWANVTGYFEPQDIALLHDELFASAGTVWSDWHAMPPAWFGSADAALYRQRLVALLQANYGDATLTVLKEPRICRLIPLWLDVFADAAIDPLFCFMDRKPLEVAASLRSRDDSSIAQGLLFYIRNHLDAEWATRGQRRRFVTYARLLADWRATVAALGIGLPPTAAQQTEVDRFLQSDLRHHQADIVVPPGDHVLHVTAEAVHAEFSRLASGGSEPQAYARLDRLRAMLDGWQRESPLRWPRGGLPIPPRWLLLQSDQNAAAASACGGDQPAT